MSIDAISTSSPASLRVASTPATGAKTPTNSTAPTSQSAPTSTVAAALKEATETAAETAKEAGHGDRQAQKLLQKHHHQHTTHAAKPASVVNGSGQTTGEISNTKA